MKDNELPRESGQNEKSAKKRIVKNTTMLGQWQVTWDKDLSIFNYQENDKKAISLKWYGYRQKQHFSWAEEWMKSKELEAVNVGQCFKELDYKRQERYYGGTWPYLDAEKKEPVGIENAS